jgi:hypothetical protein
MSVLGIVVEEESGRPMPGLRVRAFDKDLLCDDDLGDAITDAAGRFEIRFTEAHFRDFTETAPDLYIRIYDSQGRLLHSTENEVRRNAGVREVFEVAIPRAKLI